MFITDTSTCHYSALSKTVKIPVLKRCDARNGEAAYNTAYTNWFNKINFPFSKKKLTVQYSQRFAKYQTQMQHKRTLQANAATSANVHLPSLFVA